MKSARRAVGLATLAYVMGLATHMTFTYYLAPIALAGAPFIALSIFGVMLALALPAAPRTTSDVDLTDAAPTRRGARTVIAVMVTYVVLGAGYGMTAPYFTTYFLDTLHVPDDQ